MIWFFLAGAGVMVVGIVIGAAVSIGSRDAKVDKSNPS